MTALKIAQVAPLFESVPPKLYGGTERVVSYLTEELVKLGHEVTLFASGDSETKARLVAGCDRSLRLNTDCQDQLVHHIGMLQKVLDESDRFDVVHFHIDYLHFPLSRLMRLPQLTTLHGRLDIPDLVPFYKMFGDMPVVSISHRQRQPLPDANWVGNVYHGLPQDLFKPCYEDGKYLAFLGRMSAEKGVDEAIQIAIKSDLPLKIAAKVDKADKEYFEGKLRKLLDHPLVEYVGEISEKEKNDFLGNAIALIFPINWIEPFGLVMVEALACGLPVVAYRRGSVPELIDHGSSGFIVDNQDAAVNAVQNIRVLDRRECRMAFDRRFTSTRMAMEYLGVYRKVLELDKYDVKIL
ncbi:MAG TPA: glycosyltransferase family 4 protein [Chryseosolibacter sp.]